MGHSVTDGANVRDCKGYDHVAGSGGDVEPCPHMPERYYVLVSSPGGEPYLVLACDKHSPITSLPIAYPKYFAEDDWQYDWAPEGWTAICPVCGGHDDVHFDDNPRTYTAWFVCEACGHKSEPF